MPENSLPPDGEEISVDVIWGEKYEEEEKKMENVAEK
jgi:hypothetical protein